VTVAGKLNVLLIGGWVDQAFTFIRSLSTQEHINLFVADCWPNSACAHSRHCERFHLVPKYEDGGYIPALLDVCRQEQIDVVLPLHHEDLVQVAKNQQAFTNAGFRLPIPDYPLIALAIDKYRMARLAEEEGLLVPRTYLLSEVSPKDLGRNLCFPLLTKLRNSTGQRGQKRVQTIKEFEDQVHSLLERYGQEEIIVQEYIPGTVREAMYTIGLLYNHNHELRACVPLKKIRSRPYTGGTAICTVAEKRADLRHMAVKLMEAVGKWQGIADIEMKIDPDGRPAFIELNPRPWGSMYGACAAGVDFPSLWVKVALGEDFEAVEDFQEGIYASFLSRDLALLADLLKGLLAQGRTEAWHVLKTYGRPYLRQSRNARLPATSDFVLDDPEPFLRNMYRFMGFS
jgi:carbamoyl-phosphate synthase large subunit